MILLLDWFWHRAAVLALGYLVWGWRGLLAAIVAREIAGLALAALARWAGVRPARPSVPVDNPRR